VGEAEGLGALEVGQGPRHPEHPVHPAQGEVPTFQGTHEPAAERRAQSTVGASEVGAGHLGIEPPRRAGQPVLRGASGSQDPLRHHGAGLAARRVGKVGGTDGGHLDLDVHPIQQRPGQAREVPPSLQGGARALQATAAGLAAGAGVGGQDELEGGRGAGTATHTAGRRTAGPMPATNAPPPLNAL